MKHSLFSSVVLLPLVIPGAGATTAAAQTTTAPYVNDGATTGDVFTSAAGSDVAGDGSTAAPFATVARALTQADLTTHIIFIDAGTDAERVVLNKPVSLPCPCSNLGAGLRSDQLALFRSDLAAAGSKELSTNKGLKKYG